MDNVKQYRKKPVVIEACLWTGKNVEETYKFLNSAKMEVQVTYWEPVKIRTLEGVMEANKGDYIIKGVKGEFYPCKPDIFKATYEEVK